MKFPNLKKYFFSHIAVILIYVFLYFAIVHANTDFGPQNPNVFPSVAAVSAVSVFSIALFATYAIWITIAEILFRKFVIERFFPNFKLKFEIKIPKFICVIHSIIFYFGFFLATIIAILISICMIILELEDLWLLNHMTSNTVFYIS